MGEDDLRGDFLGEKKNIHLKFMREINENKIIRKVSKIYVF
jgi:hypothetical protein